MVFGEHRPPSPAGRRDSTRERKATEGVNLFCGDHRARRGPLRSNGGGDVTESEKETRRDTWTDRRIDEEGNGGKERAAGVEGIEVYLAFPVPARLLVSYFLSLSFSPSFVGLSSLTEHIERGNEFARSKGVGVRD